MIDSIWPPKARNGPVWPERCRLRHQTTCLTIWPFVTMKRRYEFCNITDYRQKTKTSRKQCCTRPSKSSPQPPRMRRASATDACAVTPGNLTFPWRRAHSTRVRRKAKKKPNPRRQRNRDEVRFVLGLIYLARVIHSPVWTVCSLAATDHNTQKQEMSSQAR